MAGLWDYTAMHRLAPKLYPEKEARDRCRAVRNGYYNEVVRALWERHDRMDYVRFQRKTLQAAANLDLSPFEIGRGILRGLAKFLGEYVTTARPN